MEILAELETIESAGLHLSSGTNFMPCAPRQHRQSQPLRLLRSAFTLIEILVVMAILGLLIGLAFIGAQRAMATARLRGVVLEMDNLTTALNSAISRSGGGLPPCMGIDPGLAALGRLEVPTNAEVFDRYVRKAYPRCTQNFASLQTLIAQGNAPYGYRYADQGGGIQTLNLGTLDPAETLVFWLGGFPAPINPATGGIYGSRRLIGFNNDPMNPFKLLVPSSGDILSNRTQPIFDFQDVRLTDVDGDGWLEYIPNLPVPVDPAPPYVYYDATIYRNQLTVGYRLPASGYPIRANTSATTTTLVGYWGSCWPFATSAEYSQIPQWVNPNTFQILCAGADGQYGNISPGSTHRRLPIFPIGQYRSGSDAYVGVTQGYAPGEEDNLTNFTTSTIGDAIPQ